MSADNDKPTTAIDVAATTPTLSRTSPEPQNLDLGFHPIKIAGEPLSETIIRDRRDVTAL